MLRKFCLIGDPLQFSLSPQIHQMFAQQFNLQIEYSLIVVPAIQVKQFIKYFFEQSGCGINITAPHKQLACIAATKLDQSAEITGATNTLYMRDGILHAANTDGIGFKNDLRQKAINLTNSKILVLGAGGAVRGILPEILKQNAHTIYLANRTVKNAEKLAAMYNAKSIVCKPLIELKKLHLDIIIHALSSNSIDMCGLYNSLQLKQTICYDLNYQDSSFFLKEAKKQGAKQAVDGLGMLIEQAAAAFYLWHGLKPNTKNVLDILECLYK